MATISAEAEQEIGPLVDKLSKAEDAKKLQTWLQIECALQRHGLADKHHVPVHKLLVHPQNRKGLMGSGVGMHRRGNKILSMGVDLALLNKAASFQLSSDPAKRAHQISKNKEFAASSDLIAPVNGQETVVCIASTHAGGFFKAVWAQRPTPHPALQDVEPQLYKW